MKKIEISIDYSEYDVGIKKMFFFSNGNLIHHECPVTTVRNDDGEKIELPKPYILNVELDIPKDADLVIGFESEKIDEPFFSSAFEFAMTNLLFSLVAFAFRISEHFQTYYLQTYYGYAKRWKLVCSDNASFDLKFKYATKDCPVCNLEYENQSNCYIEEYYRPCDFKRDYKTYKKSVVLNCVILLVLAAIFFSIALVIDGSRVLAMVAFTLIADAIIFFFRNMIVSKLQYKKLKECNWNLDAIGK